MNWTQNHDQFCLENKLTPTAKLLWQWLVHNYKSEEEVEPDLQAQFNAWIKKHLGKERSPNTIKDALNRLIECGAIRKIKQWNWHEVRIIFFPPYFFVVKKNSQNRHQIDKTQPSNNQSTETPPCSSSNINHDPIIDEEDVAEGEKVLDACEAAGIVFNPIKSPEILQYCLEEVQLAIELFQQRGGHQKIKNPQGWLLQCLRKYWFDEPQGWTFSDLIAAFSPSYTNGKIDFSYAK
ncbi:MAG: hypothetical protein HEQ10_23130 [Dolichospermum sp. DEX182a]|nr:hypothetical protein [Dolichospermum sp. DEX182a]